MMSNADIPAIVTSGMDEYDFSHLISDPTKTNPLRADFLKERKMIYWWKEDTPNHRKSLSKLQVS
jgi:hypothetical protein